MLQNDVSTKYLAITDLMDEVDFQVNSIANKLFENETGYIWNFEKDPFYKKNFADVVKKSLHQSKVIAGFYSETNWASRLVVLSLGLIFYLLMRRSIRRIQKNDEATVVLKKANHVPANLITSTLVFSLMLIPIIYQEAPQAFTQSLWGMQIIALAFLLRKKLNMVVGAQLFLLLVLFYVTGFSNLLIETTYTERWIQLLISFVSILLAVWMLVAKKEHHFTRFKLFKPLMFLYGGMTTVSLLLNIMGRVSLAKVLNTGASYGIIEALILLVFIEIIIDVVYLLSTAGNKDSRLLAYFEFNGIESRIRKGLGIFALLFWLVIFTKSIQVYDVIFGNLKLFFSYQWQLGEVTFSFGSIGIFVLVIWISSLLSQMISFIFGAQDANTSRNSGGKMGSTILLVRLGIFSLGIILAFAASGIPLDKLAIIIGALGVGIGFGLQTIVNNLVSGVVLAFEKPIQIGDIIEVNDRSGTVKEIGIRSSKLTTFDGSEVIIPNGDLLAHHLINWTRNNENRRVVIPVGVAYGSDVQQVKDIVLKLVVSNKDVFPFPAPLVRVLNFGDSSVDMNVYFWAEVDKWYDLKSDMMQAIYEQLNKEGISIPFPQRDLHIKSIDEDILKDMISKNKVH